jgi:predicted DNA-binding protein (MmcQ/YjbR family)
MAVTLQAIREHCLKKKGVAETFPFDEETLVLKVMNKMFLLIDIYNPLTINIKCDPEKALELRADYEEVTPGFHMNKKYWNTVDITGNLSPKIIYEWIDHSYDEVVKGLKKKEKEELLDN